MTGGPSGGSPGSRCREADQEGGLASRVTVSWRCITGRRGCRGPRQPVRMVLAKADWLGGTITPACSDVHSKSARDSTGSPGRWRRRGRRTRQGDLPCAFTHRDNPGGRRHRMPAAESMGDGGADGGSHRG